MPRSPRPSKAVLCSKCRQLISNQETQCPHCGAVQPNLFGLAGGLRKLYRDVLQPVQVVLVLSVSLYVLSLAANVQAAMNPAGLFDLGAPSGLALYLLGMTGGEAWACGHVWTLLTASLLHGSLLHIFFNLYWLRALGPLTTNLLGPARFLVLFFLAGVGGFVVSNMVSGVPTIGASAGLFGLMGALLVFGWRRGGTAGQALKSNMITYAAIGFALSFAMPRVNNWGHLGGFIAGGLLVLAMPKHEGRHEGRGVQLLALALLVATVAGVGLSVWQMWDTWQTGARACS